jgi:hypothetical protein
MRGLWSTLALVAVLAGLGAYIYFVDSERPASGLEPKEKVFAVESGTINELRVTAQGETTALVRKDAGWQITEPVSADADATETSSFVTNLSSLEVNRVVDENAADLAPYGLASPRISVSFKAEGGASGEIRLGDKTPTGGDLYAVRPGEKKVFLVSSYLDTTFDKKTFDLRDKRAVKFERDKVESVQVARGAESIRMTRAGSEWKIEAPVAGRADYPAVEGLLTRLSTAAMASIVDAQASDLTKYGLDKPSLVITLGAGSSQTVLEVGKKEGDRPYARDRSRPMIFTLDTTLTDDLGKAFDDYRKKDLFDSRPFDTDRVQLTHVSGGTTRTFDFEKRRENDTDTWRVTPQGGSAANVERTKMDELLNKLSALRAASFARSGTKTGLDRPALNVGVSYDGGKWERILVGEAGGTQYGAREGENVVAQLEAGSMAAVITALDAALTPPPAPAPTPASTPPETKK